MNRNLMKVKGRRGRRGSRRRGSTRRGRKEGERGRYGELGGGDRRAYSQIINNINPKKISSKFSKLEITKD